MCESPGALFASSHYYDLKLDSAKSECDKNFNESINGFDLINCFPKNAILKLYFKYVIIMSGHYDLFKLWKFCLSKLHS